ncbi:hypothetical protein K450DRAFT_248445 [Umbelopsis ramanniana AG]|uniref:Uncharacterized protein n=1 Tax=Umbelopsis ramanniana AG TaxID=1314678 RepID=A0AAD5E8A1_UMBRA|nr:uncharacterized protein K450DRAFT_248445 [Umbelopsis ramanniana AG]KAI8578171.1 hypothetical protein K450DRAFT_248445 [Umbelopsis ramanniana AG]
MHYDQLNSLFFIVLSWQGIKLTHKSTILLDLKAWWGECKKAIIYNNGRGRL